MSDIFISDNYASIPQVFRLLDNYIHVSMAVLWSFYGYFETTWDLLLSHPLPPLLSGS
jgi:hypothetical protein